MGTVFGLALSKFHGHNSKSAKVTGEMVLEIRRLYALGDSQGFLSRKFHLSIGQIGRIVRGESWQHIPTVARVTQGDIDASLKRLQHDIEQVVPEGETPLERMQADVAKERTPSDSVDKFVNPDKADEYIGGTKPPEKEEK